MSNKNTKLLVENWRAFLKEAEVTPDPQVAVQVDKIIKEPYEKFVADLTKVAADPRVQAVIQHGLNDGKPDDEKMAKKELSIPVTKLKPTQNEIALDKSLGGSFGPLENLKTAELYLKGGDVLVPSKNGGPIVTAYNGAFIVDGHHRWSSLYCINKDAKIKSIDLTVQGLKPTDYLKIVQLAIAADIKKVPTATAKGSINLITISEDQLKQYVIANLKDELLPIYKKYGKGTTKQEVANFIWTNIQSMQKTGIPVQGSPKRDVMPQTDDASNAIPIAASGKINFRDTAKVAEALEKRIEKIIIEEIKKLNK